MNSLIGLVDVDSKIPNLALMKISTYHKNKGDNVEWWKGMLFNKRYDKAYASKVFDFTPFFEQFEFPENTEIGGSGYDLKKRLPDEIEGMDLDYSIYPDCDYSIQRFSTGCTKACGFCIVRKKEGFLKPANAMNLNPKGKFVRLIDNNFFANPLWKEAIKCLKDIGLPVWFEGIDARDLTKEQAKALLELKHYKQIHMAWDNPKDDIDWARIISWIKAYRIMVYVLIGYNTTKEEDLYRVETLRNYKIDPFIMPFNKFDSYQKRFARWVNHKAIFKSVKWKDYKVG